MVRQVYVGGWKGDLEQRMQGKFAVWFRWPSGKPSPYQESCGGVCFVVGPHETQPIHLGGVAGHCEA